MEYTIYGTHPDDGQIKIIVTPWKPDLLECLEGLIEIDCERCGAMAWANKLPVRCDPECDYSKAKAAVAKAKGEDHA